MDILGKDCKPWLPIGANHLPYVGTGVECQGEDCSREICIMLWHSQMRFPDNLCHGFLYIFHSMCPGPPLYWVECLRSRPGHLNWVHPASGPGSFLRASCPAIELGATCIDEGLPLPAMKLGMAYLCYHTFVYHNGGLSPPAIELRVAWPPTSVLWVELPCDPAPPNKVDS